MIAKYILYALFVINEALENFHISPSVTIPSLRCGKPFKLSRTNEYGFNNIFNVSLDSTKKYKNNKSFVIAS